jgi:hypothetical protein
LHRPASNGVELRSISRQECLSNNRSGYRHCSVGRATVIRAAANGFVISIGGLS